MVVATSLLITLVRLLIFFQIKKQAYEDTQVVKGER